MITTEAGWRADGSPVLLAVPILEIRRSLGIIYGSAIVAKSVGTLGDPRHLSADPAEDHTPYSETGWPVHSEYPYVHALDDATAGFKRRFAHYLSEKRAGRAPWVKYINLDGWHYEFQPNETKRHSSDGPEHGHLSVRSDWTHRSIAYGWKILRQGDTGEQVKTYQTMLNAHILRLSDKLDEDGIFGPRTATQTVKFQANRAISPDSIAGPRTRIELATIR